MVRYYTSQLWLPRPGVFGLQVKLLYAILCILQPLKGKSILSTDTSKPQKLYGLIQIHTPFNAERQACNNEYKLLHITYSRTRQGNRIQFFHLRNGRSNQFFYFDLLFIANMFRDIFKPDLFTRMVET